MAKSLGSIIASRRLAAAAAASRSDGVWGETPQSYLGRVALANAAALSGVNPQVASVSYWAASKKPYAVRSRSTDWEDNRSWSPGAIVKSRPYKIGKQYRMLRGTPAKITISKSSTVKPYRRGSLTASGIQFRAPSYVILCIRRKRRRAAILASGRGGSKHKRARFNYNSNIWC